MFGGDLTSVLERRMANRAACSNVNVRGVKPSNANVKACVDRKKAAANALGGGRRTRRGSRRGGNAVAAMERRMAERAKCSNVNVRGVKPSNANVKACVDRMKAAAAGGRRTRRGGSRKSRRSTRRSTRRSWF